MRIVFLSVIVLLAVACQLPREADPSTMELWSSRDHQIDGVEYQIASGFARGVSFWITFYVDEAEQLEDESLARALAYHAVRDGHWSKGTTSIPAWSRAQLNDHLTVILRHRVDATTMGRMYYYSVPKLKSKIASDEPARPRAIPTES